MQDFNAVGRTVCLSPITWVDGWPYFGLEKMCIRDRTPHSESLPLLIYKEQISLLNNFPTENTPVLHTGVSSLEICRIRASIYWIFTRCV